MDASLKQQAELWINADPDPVCRQELQALVDDLPRTSAQLADRFADRLTFGTAGLRGPMRAGPNGFNQAVVRQTAAGLVAWLTATDAQGPIVIGYDGRHGSRRFAQEAARVATAAGWRALVLPRPLPTPVLAYAVRRLNAVVGIMITASHNPAADNGMKVYLGQALGGVRGSGAQIAPPIDTAIEGSIKAAGAVDAIPLGEPGELINEALIESYLDGAVGVLSPESTVERASLTTAYTALHGVGNSVLTEAFTRAGFRAPASVAEQAQPDPDFPTVPFPNPEEPAAMDLLLELAQRIGADLAIANDPDADRCSVAIPVGVSAPMPAAAPDAAPTGGWRVLTGDEVGILLADHLIRRGTPGLFATTIVSSSLLAKLCAARGVPFAETLTGFKWIVRAGDSGSPRLAYGYEEALGYCAAPELVRDKDGITAALLMAELAAMLAAQGSNITHRLSELAAEFGLHATEQISVRVAHLSELDTLMAGLRAGPPASLLGTRLTSLEDLRPESDVLVWRTPQTRVVVRPSGTEPKLKAYLEVVSPVDGPAEPALAAARRHASASLAHLRAEVSGYLSAASR